MASLQLRVNYPQLPVLLTDQIETLIWRIHWVEVFEIRGGKTGRVLWLTLKIFCPLRPTIYYYLGRPINVRDRRTILHTVCTGSCGQ